VRVSKAVKIEVTKEQRNLSVDIETSRKMERGASAPNSSQEELAMFSMTGLNRNSVGSKSRESQFSPPEMSPTSAHRVVYSNTSSSPTDSMSSPAVRGLEAASAAALETSVLVDPHRASGLESLWLEKIKSKLPNEELKETWSKIARYFNGYHALEKIHVKEQLGRKDVRKALVALEQEGVLVIVRHW
jgi:hypothetical protein